MTGEALFELLGGLDAEMVDAAGGAPRKTGRFLRIAAPIAAALLITVIFAFYPARDKKADVMEPNGGGSMTDSTPWIDGIVTETDGFIVVTPVEGSPFYGEADRYVLTMTDFRPAAGNMPEDLRVGEGVRVMCNPDRFIPVDETTVEVPIVFAVYRHVGNVDLHADLDRSALAGRINELYGGELERKAAGEDIDLERAYRIYVDTNIFALPGSDLGEILTSLDHGPYIYLLPVTVGDKTVMVNLQIGLPLNPDADFTGEERQEVLADEGRWIASAFSLYQTGQEPDYRAALEKALGETPAGAALVGGLPFFRDPVAIVRGENGEPFLVPLSDSFDAGAVRALELAPGVYDYAAVKDYVNSLPAPDRTLNGG